MRKVEVVNCLNRSELLAGEVLQFIVAKIQCFYSTDSVESRSVYSFYSVVVKEKSFENRHVRESLRMYPRDFVVGEIEMA